MSHVQSTSASPGAITTTNLSLTSVVAGHALLAVIRISNGTDHVSGVADDVNGAWTQIANVLNGAASVRTYVYKKEGGASGSPTITLTCDTSVTVRWGVAEYSESIVEDIDTATFTTTTTPASPSTTSSVSGDTIVSVVSPDASATTIVPASSETERWEVDVRLQLQDKAAGAAGGYTGSWTLGATQPGVVIAMALMSSSSVVWPQYQHRRSTLITM